MKDVVSGSHGVILKTHRRCASTVERKVMEYNQTAKSDKGKIRPTLVPRQIIRDIAVVREYGDKKYGSTDNWKQVEIERYRDALCRHLLAYLDDPKSVDEESGISHYKHMATNMAFICEMERWDDEKDM